MERKYFRLPEGIRKKIHATSHDNKHKNSKSKAPHQQKIKNDMKNFDFGRISSEKVKVRGELLKRIDVSGTIDHGEMLGTPFCLFNRTNVVP